MSRLAEQTRAHLTSPTEASTMQARELIEKARALPLEDRLQVVQGIWDAIAAENEAPPLSEWQTAELERRERLYRAGQEQLQDISEVHARLRNGA
jgi:putative addiction module component (TIGR02574 family)